jgi:hypothetical protein
MHKHPNAMPNYVAIKVIAMILVVASIIICNASLRGNNHDYCNNIKNRCKVLLQYYYLQPFLTKVTWLLLEDIATNMTILQPYFTVAIDQFSSSVHAGRCALGRPISTQTAWSVEPAHKAKSWLGLSRPLWP